MADQTTLTHDATTDIPLKKAEKLLQLLQDDSEKAAVATGVKDTTGGDAEATPAAPGKETPGE
jgi:hypothetical protein